MPNESDAEAPEATMRRMLDSLGRWLTALPFWLFTLLVLGVGVLRVGPLGIGSEFIGWVRESAAAFPEPVNWISSCLASVLTMRGLGQPGDAVWWALGVVLWLVVLVSLLIATRRAGEWQRPAILVIALSPAFTVSVTMLGHYDIYLIAGSLLVALGRRWPSLVLGAVLVVLGNPEQALVSALALLIAAIGLRNRDLIRRTAVYLAVAMAAFIGIRLWQAAYDFTSGRLDAISDVGGLTTASFKAFLGVWPLALYAFLGGLWIIVILALRYRGPWRVLAILIGVLALPALASMTTIDGTRVFVTTGLAVLAALIVTTWRERWSQSEPSPAITGALALLLVLLPAVIIDSGGTLRLPYADILRLISG